MKLDIKNDGLSYPNKITRQIFSYLPVENLKYEYQDTWTNRKIYDVYFEYQGQKYLVEIDGQQHYKNSMYSTLEYQQQNDEYKNKLAKQNNIPLIRIDCQESKFYYIKNSFLNSELNKIFDLTILDWNKIRLDSVKNAIIEVCQYYDKYPDKTTVEIAEDLKLNRTTVLNYLKEGADCGICTYTVEKAKELAAQKRASNRSKNQKTVQIDIYDKNDNFIGHYSSLNSAANELQKLYPTMSFSGCGLKRAGFVHNMYKDLFKVVLINDLPKDFNEIDLKIFEYYNANNYPSLEEICNKFNVTINHLRSILLQGKAAGLCNFNSQESYNKTLEKRIIATKKRNGYSFIAYLNGEFFGEFNSMQEFINYEKDHNTQPYIGREKLTELVKNNKIEYKGWKISTLEINERRK